MAMARAQLLLPVVLAACDSLAGQAYVGEPLITLAGTFAPSAGTPSDVGAIALLWQDAEGASGPGKAMVAVPVSIEFPAAFAVEVPSPPPPDVMFAFDDGIALAECYVYVIADADTLRLLGADRTHALVFATDDIPATSSAAAYLGGPVAAGYTLRRYAETERPSLQQAALIDRCTARGESVAACTARHRYQLSPALSEDEPLRIVLYP